MTQTVGKKLFLVVNPVSGKKLARHYVKGMMERFGEAGFVVTSVYTRKDENAYEIVRKRGETSKKAAVISRVTNILPSHKIPSKPDLA